MQIELLLNECGDVVADDEFYEGEAAFNEIGFDELGVDCINDPTKLFMTEVIKGETCDDPGADEGVGLEGIGIGFTFALDVLTDTDAIEAVFGFLEFFD